jgi:hypothetical protein
MSIPSDKSPLLAYFRYLKKKRGLWDHRAVFLCLCVAHNNFLACVLAAVGTCWTSRYIETVVSYGSAIPVFRRAVPVNFWWRGVVVEARRVSRSHNFPTAEWELGRFGWWFKWSMVGETTLCQKGERSELLCRIWGFYSGGYEEFFCLLGYNTV